MIVVLFANSKPSNVKAWRRDRGIALTSAVLAVGSNQPRTLDTDVRHDSHGYPRSVDVRRLAN